MRLFAILMINLIIINPAFSKTISFAGDSISYGLGNNKNYKNGGIVGSGLTVGDPELNFQHWSKYTKNTDLSIIEIGTNDFSYKGRSYYDLLTKYILPLNSSNKICLVSIPEPLHRTDVKNGISKLNEVEKFWAMNYNLKYVFFPKFDYKDKVKDGIHFTPSAYKRISLEIINKCEK